MPEEFEEGEEEEIPEGLAERWRREAAKGLRAGVCKECGHLFGQDDLSCGHCGAPVELPRAAPWDWKRWLVRTPLGAAALAVILAAIFAYLLRP
jgi:hypothetical protein